VSRQRRTVAADPLYDVYEVAEYLKLDHTTVRGHIKSGVLECVRLGPAEKLIRVRLSAINTFLATDHAPKEKRTYVRRVKPEEKVVSLSEAWDRRRNKHVG
jgi:excisionase family DNA binding protein